DRFGPYLQFMSYVVKDKTRDDVLPRTHDAARALQPLVKDHTIASYQSLATFRPPREQQLAVMRRLEEGRADRFNFERINKTFHEALITNGFRPDVFDEYMQSF